MIFVQFFHRTHMWTHFLISLIASIQTYNLQPSFHLALVLDINILLTNNSFSITSYVKPSNTGLYIPSFSFCPQKYKSNTLFERAYKIFPTFTKHGFHYLLN